MAFHLCLQHSGHIEVRGTIEHIVTIRTEPKKLALVANIATEERIDIPMQIVQVPMTDRQRIKLSFDKAQDTDGNLFDIEGPIVPVANDPTAVIVVPNPDPAVTNGWFIYAARVPGKLGLQKVTFTAQNAGFEVDAIVGGSAPTDLVPGPGGAPIAEDFDDAEFPGNTPGEPIAA